MQKLSACFLCGTPGHLVSQCPNRHCNNCGLPGHLYDACSERAYWHKQCHRCGMTGHFFDVSEATICCVCQKLCLLGRRFKTFFYILFILVCSLWKDWVVFFWRVNIFAHFQNLFFEHPQSPRWQPNYFILVAHPMQTATIFFDFHINRPPGFAEECHLQTHHDAASQK